MLFFFKKLRKGHFQETVDTIKSYGTLDANLFQHLKQR